MTVSPLLNPHPFVGTSTLIIYKGYCVATLALAPGLISIRIRCSKYRSGGPTS